MLRIILWTLGGLVILGVVAAIALQIAISRDGPWVLSTVDRITGGNRDVFPKALISTGEHAQQKLVVWGPDPKEGGDARPVLVFVHGGGWRSGDPESYDFIARAFVPEGFVVVLAGYRLGEDGIYPAMLEDTAADIAWVKQNIAKYGGDPDRIVLAGHSAGAYNVVMMGLDPRWLGARGMSTGDIAGVIGMAGPYDFVPFDKDSTIAAFGHVSNPPETQPVEYARADAPPMLLVYGEEDELVGAHNIDNLATAIREAGGQVETAIYPGMSHEDPLIALASPWRGREEVAAAMAAFAKAAVESRSAPPAVSVPVQAESR